MNGPMDWRVSRGIFCTLEKSSRIRKAGRQLTSRKTGVQHLLRVAARLTLRPIVDRDVAFVASRARLSDVVVVLDQLWRGQGWLKLSNRNRSNDLDEIWARL
jgi:hypothetical protein